VPATEPEPEFRRLWPAHDPGPLSDEEILAAYPTPDGQRLLRVNFVSSVDGSVTLDGRSAPLGGPGDRKILSLLRVACDAVVVGAGTVRVEGYSPLRTAAARQRLRSGSGRTADPVLVLVTRRLDFEPSDPRFTQAPQRPIVVTTEETAARVGDRFAEVADVLGVGAGEVDLAAAVGALAERGLPHLLCEGGPHLLGALLDADLVDEFCLTVAPKLVGPGPGRIVAGAPTDVRALALSQVLAAGDELLLRYVRP
jgi:riboflavin biosynthesis pyrimidine reductase